MLKPDTAIILGLMIEEPFTRLEDEAIRHIAVNELENGLAVFNEASNLYYEKFLYFDEHTKLQLRKEVFSLHLTLNQIKNAYANGYTSEAVHIHQIIAETENSTNTMNALFQFPTYNGEEDDQSYRSFMNIFGSKK
ncbi:MULTISPECIES: hypothetical protein [Priestia]|uniref:hypothetical protein n=1 Tax=Priestia TaxID=2800373 RepID=UPI0009570361|nr:hypothetical protein [Priestia flexa]SIQ91179.1 hypothetical protein SAMN05880580_1103 [Priestia flexa]